MAIGTNNDDLFVGSEGPDEYFALGGADIVAGMGGDDLLDLGAGANSAGGGAGDLISGLAPDPTTVLQPRISGIAGPAGSGTAIDLRNGNERPLHRIGSRRLTAAHFSFDPLQTRRDRRSRVGDACGGGAR